MTPTLDVVRAWKDESYRASLAPAERAGLPQNPAGEVELSDEQAAAAVGAFTNIWRCPQTQGTCFYACDTWEFACDSFGLGTFLCCGS